MTTVPQTQMEFRTVGLKMDIPLLKKNKLVLVSLNFSIERAFINTCTVSLVSVSDLIPTKLGTKMCCYVKAEAVARDLFIFSLPQFRPSVPSVFF